MIDPELVFIDHGCGAKEPFCEEDPISSKLQHLFFPGPGFIEDTPDVVTRLIAKWHNRQYAKQIEKEMRKYSDEYEEAETKGDADKANDVADRWAEEEKEIQRGLHGRRGREDHPARSDRPRRDVEVAVEGPEPAGRRRRRGHRRDHRDLESRFPVRVPGQEASATDAAYGRAETTRLATALDHRRFGFRRHRVHQGGRGPANQRPQVRAPRPDGQRLPSARYRSRGWRNGPAARASSPLPFPVLSAEPEPALRFGGEVSKARRRAAPPP